MLVRFASSEFKCVRFVAANRYLQCDAARDDSVLNENGRLTVAEVVGETL